jgi:hypothetical protein
MQSGYVYLLRGIGALNFMGGDLYKIGKSATPDRRTKDFSGYPWPVELLHQISTSDMGWLESRLHRQYACTRQHGEWFALSRSDLKRLLAIKVLDRCPQPTFWGYGGCEEDPVNEKNHSLPGVDRARDLLSRSGWTVSDARSGVIEGNSWLVSAYLGENVIYATGGSQAEAWGRACERARAVGMLGWGGPWVGISRP